MYLFFHVKIKERNEFFESERLHNTNFFSKKSDNTVIISGIFNNNIDKRSLSLDRKI